LENIFQSVAISTYMTVGKTWLRFHSRSTTYHALTIPYLMYYLASTAIPWLVCRQEVNKRVVVEMVVMVDAPYYTSVRPSHLDYVESPYSYA
jgi:hypothetical protein